MLTKSKQMNTIMLAVKDLATPELTRAGVKATNKAVFAN